MVTLIIIVILTNTFLIIVLILILYTFFLIWIIIRLKSSNSFMITWFPLLILSETILSLSHLIVFSSKHIIIISLIIEDLFLLNLFLLVLELVDDVLLVLSSLVILQIVHIKFMLQIINVSEFFNIHSVESLQLKFKMFIFFLIFWLNIFNTLQSFFSTLQLLLSSTKFVHELTFIEFQLLNGIIHFSHLPGLVINDISNTFLNINLFSICVQVSWNRI